MSSFAEMVKLPDCQVNSFDFTTVKIKLIPSLQSHSKWERNRKRGLNIVLFIKTKSESE